jgi:hypothetical protein
MLTIHRRSGLVKAAVAAPVLAVVLAACGGSSSGGSASSATPTPSSTGQAGQRGGGAFGAQFTAIEQCLKAAGIAVPTARARPSGSSFPRPSGSFNGTPPAGGGGFNGTPGTRPSGGFGGGAGGIGTILNSSQAKAALKACGITIPTGQFQRPAASATAAG